MATKTVVCPECGAPATPGRYACAQCGALLAAVAIQPRELTTLDPASTIGDAAPVAPMEPASDPATGAESTRIEDEIHDPGFDTSPELDLEPTPPGLADILRPAPTWPPGADAPMAAPAAAPAMAAPEMASPAMAAPGLRTPAGAYLPPSAVLPPLDGPTVAAPAAGPAASVGGGVEARPEGRRLPSLDGLLAGLEMPGRLTRRAVGTGAAIASISFLLPWINGLPGAGLNGYLDRWGFAGPGLWIVFLAAGSLGAVALSSGRTASWPVGLAGVALGSLLLGLVWPSVFGGGAAIGVWFAFIGALVLAVGGGLDLGARHGSLEPSV